MISRAAVNGAGSQPGSVVGGGAMLRLGRRGSAMQAPFHRSSGIGNADAAVFKCYLRIN
ncbi:hypothetical protein PLANPX_5670 [Lacipirellula parvula]|uniref:Uncharacterized protein n=1 Tax=Lacipirellula parvula TaxID=2650471 RepID=A0A5K7XHY5_9BACT|nr:hypothetical protein PLANPX_5670 [Lacipirellula parvula]